MKRILIVTGGIILVCVAMVGGAVGSWLIYEIGAAVSDWLK